MKHATLILLFLGICNELSGMKNEICAFPPLIAHQHKDNPQSEEHSAPTKQKQTYVTAILKNLPPTPTREFFIKEGFIKEEPIKEQLIEQNNNSAIISRDNKVLLQDPHLARQAILWQAFINNR